MLSEWIWEKGHWLKYFVRAKGRHGTHSPFVYAFVEQVLRGGRDDRPAKGQRRIDRVNLRAAAVVHFLSTREVMLYKTPGNDLLEDLTLLCPGVKPEVRFVLTDLPEQPVPPLLFLHMQDYDSTVAAYLKAVSATPFCVFCFGIHQNKRTATHWDQLRHQENFPMTLDFWDAGCLLKDRAFKIKQHFVLRP